MCSRKGQKWICRRRNRGQHLRKENGCMASIGVFLCFQHLLNLPTVESVFSFKENYGNWEASHL